MLIVVFGLVVAVALAAGRDEDVVGEALRRDRAVWRSAGLPLEIDGADDCSAEARP